MSESHSHDGPSDDDRTGVVGAAHREGAPTDWWGDDSGEDSPSTEPSTPAEHSRDLRRRAAVKNDRHEWVAHRVLKRGARFFCPISLNEHNEDIFLSEPEAWVPEPPLSGEGPDGRTPLLDNVTVGPKRVNERRGYLLTGGVLEERSTEDLMSVVEEIISGVDIELRKREVRAIRQFVKQAKRANEHDEDIVTTVLRAIDRQHELRAVDLRDRPENTRERQHAD